MIKYDPICSHASKHVHRWSRLSMIEDIWKWSQRDPNKGFFLLQKAMLTLHCIALLCFALHCIAFLCFALLCFALLSIALHCCTLLCIGLHSFALLCIALHCFALLCTALHCFALLCMALYCFALLCFALHCIALRCFALLCGELCEDARGTQAWRQSWRQLWRASQGSSGFLREPGRARSATKPPILLQK